MLASPQNNCGSGREHVQFKTVRRLNSRNWCNIGASPDISWGRHIKAELLLYTNVIEIKTSFFKNDILYLSGFLKDLASNIEQNPLNHSDGYASQDICPIFFASASKNAMRTKKYPG